MDVVYPFISVPGADEELRYSIRSLERHTNVEKICLVGSRPDFLNCELIRFVDLDPAGNAEIKLLNVHRKIRAACREDRISDPFLLMNDDIMLAEPLDFAHFTCGMLGDLLERRKHTDSYYSEAIGRTAELAPQARNYETHTPMVIYKDRFLSVPVQNPLTLFRTLYGQREDRLPVVDLGEDVKHYQNLSTEIFSRFIDGRPFFSLSPGFRKFGMLRRLYPRASRWEDES